MRSKDSAPDLTRLVAVDPKVFEYNLGCISLISHYPELGLGKPTNRHRERSQRFAMEPRGNSLALETCRGNVREVDIGDLRQTDVSVAHELIIPAVRL